MLPETGGDAGTSEPLCFSSNPSQTGGDLDADRVPRCVQRARAEARGGRERRGALPRVTVLLNAAGTPTPPTTSQTLAPP